LIVSGSAVIGTPNRIVNDRAVVVVLPIPTRAYHGIHWSQFIHDSPLFQSVSAALLSVPLLLPAV